MRLRSLAARYSGHILFFGEFMERDAVEATSKGVSWWCFVSGSTQVLVVRTKTIGYLLIRRNTTKHLYIRGLTDASLISIHIEYLEHGHMQEYRESA